MGLVAVVALGLACLPACNRGSGKTKIGIVTNCTAEFWSICEAGARKQAAIEDVELVFRQPTNMDAAEQLPIIEGFVAQGCKGIGVSVIKPDGQTRDLTRIGKQVPLITMDNDADQTGRRCYIGIDNKDAGKAVARLVKSVLPKGGTVALFIGSTESANGQARSQGVLDGLAGTDNAVGVEVDHPKKPAIKCLKYGDFYIVDKKPRTDDGKSTVATDNATDVLTRLEGLDDVCMVGLYAYNPPAILRAVAAKKMTGKVFVVGFDEDWDTLAAIQDGRIVGTVVQDPFKYGEETVRLLAGLARDPNFPMPGPNERIAHRIVTRTGTEPLPPGPEVVRVTAKQLEDKLRADLASVK